MGLQNYEFDTCFCSHTFRETLQWNVLMHNFSLYGIISIGYISCLLLYMHLWSSFLCLGMLLRVCEMQVQNLNLSVNFNWPVIVKAFLPADVFLLQKLQIHMGEHFTYSLIFLAQAELVMPLYLIKNSLSAVFH